MWTRKEVKQKGMNAFTLNYWRCILVALILTVLVGGASASGSGFTFRLPGPGAAASTTAVSATDDEYEIDIDESQMNEIVNDMVSSYDDLDPGIQTAITGMTVAGVVILIISALVIFLIIAAIAIAFDAFVLNPLVVGGERFFVRNLDEPAKVSNIGFSFDHNYGNIVKIMFFRDLYTFLWALLFIIPGIVKLYEYRMIPYILADNPDISMEEAFAKTKQMMTGNKWKAFVLDLSFIGWHILNAMTLGILGLFYLTPYIYSTNAALYRKLSETDNSEVVTEEANEL